VRSKEDKFDRLVPGFFAIRTSDHNVIPLFSTRIAIQVYDDEIAFHRAGIEALPISLQRLAYRDGILNNHIDFFPD